MSNDDKVYKINPSLIKKIKSIIKKYPIEYPTIKNFIEISVLRNIKRLSKK